MVTQLPPVLFTGPGAREVAHLLIEQGVVAVTNSSSPANTEDIATVPPIQEPAPSLAEKVVFSTNSSAGPFGGRDFDPLRPGYMSDRFSVHSYPYTGHSSTPWQRDLVSGNFHAAAAISGTGNWHTAEKHYARSALLAIRLDPSLAENMATLLSDNQVFEQVVTRLVQNGIIVSSPISEAPGFVFTSPLMNSSRAIELKYFGEDKVLETLFASSLPVFFDGFHHPNSILAATLTAMRNNLSSGKVERLNRLAEIGFVASTVLACGDNWILRTLVKGTPYHKLNFVPGTEAAIEAQRSFEDFRRSLATAGYKVSARQLKKTAVYTGDGKWAIARV